MSNIFNTIHLLEDRLKSLLSNYEFLKEAGVAEIFGPGTPVIDAANAVLGHVLGERRNR